MFKDHQVRVKKNLIFVPKKKDFKFFQWSTTPTHYTIGAKKTKWISSLDFFLKVV